MSRRIVICVVTGGDLALGGQARDQGSTPHVSPCSWRVEAGEIAELVPQISVSENLGVGVVSCDCADCVDVGGAHGERIEGHKSRDVAGGIARKADGVESRDVSAGDQSKNIKVVGGQRDTVQTERCQITEPVEYES